MKHRKEEEARKKREEDETARLYAEFLESFQEDNKPGTKNFVREGALNQDERLKDSEGGNSKDGVSFPKKGSRYVPSFIPPSLATKGKELEKQEERPKEKERKKSRNIDNILKEFKIKEELRERRNHQHEHNEKSALLSQFDELPDDFDQSGKLAESFDDTDPQTTNLCVGNISPQVDENFLLRIFGRFGPIASVKIIWPQTKKEWSRQRNCGFVSFVNRADGQAAKNKMQGVVVYGHKLVIGWSKSVSLPAQVLPAPPPGHMAIRSKEVGIVILSDTDGPAAIMNQNSELVRTPNVPDIIVVPPEDEHLRHVIDSLARHVLDGGCAFEEAIMERVQGNPLFNFLFELGTKEHTYYRWRLYSFAQGDTLQRWRTEPFIMITGSGRWMPPPLQSTECPENKEEFDTTFSVESSRYVELERYVDLEQYVEVEGTLTVSQRDEFEDILRTLTLERRHIKEAMGFALDHADAAQEIVEVLTESLTLKETPISKKVARLMLVSDILHNSRAPIKNAFAYRSEFQATLPDIMKSFNDLYHRIEGRITAEALKERVLKVLQVWSIWLLFSDAYVNELRATFLRSRISSVILDAPEIGNKSSSEDMAEGSKITKDTVLSTGNETAMELSDLPLAELERRCRHNRISLVGGREMMVARLLSLKEARQMSYNRDDDKKYGQSHSNSERYSKDESCLNANDGDHRKIIFGMKLESSRSNNYGEDVMQLHGQGKPDPILPISNWALEDDGGVVEDKRSAWDLGLSYSFSVGYGPIMAHDMKVATDMSILSQHDSRLADEQRKKLRHMELALIDYREYLEERGIWSYEEIDKKVAIHRRQLHSEYGLSDSNQVVLDYDRSYIESYRRDYSHESSRKRHCSHGTWPPTQFIYQR